MRYGDIVNSATMGHPERVRPLVGWTIVEYLLRGAPYGILLVVVWEIFGPLQNPGSAMNLERIATACLGLLVALVLLHAVTRKSYFASYKESYEICADGRIAIAEHLRRLPMGFFNTRDPGDIGAYLVTDYANVEMLLSHLVPQFCGALAMPVLLLLFLAVCDWKLAAATALVILLAAPLAWISMRIVDYFGRKHQKVKVEAASRMIEYIQGIRLVKAFRLQGEKFDRLEKAFRRLKVESIRLEGSVGPTMVLAAFVLNTGLTLVMLLGYRRIEAGTLPLPLYVTFLILVPRVYEPLFHALMFMGELNYMKLGVRRIESLRTTQPLPEPAAPAHLEDFGIDLRHVTFRYRGQPVLHDISLSIPARSLTALVGPSGSGKTTITRLIARFWDVDEGEIRIGGKDIRTLSSDDLLSRISMVFQDVYLFHDTIYNNIRVGRPDATPEQVEAAARAARCHEFIERLPDRYHTLVGEGGSTLSGGEKQRISIARAILKDAPIVLLDEATAALDPENEHYIQQAINDLVRNKTVVVIAHRLHTVVQADRIVVLDAGRVVDVGTHAQLMERRGLYAALWEEQQRVKSWKFSAATSASR
jgi:ATP-binding cassette subfamily B protein IrtB